MTDTKYFTQEGAASLQTRTGDWLAGHQAATNDLLPTIKRMREALSNIAANTTDCGNPKGKDGDALIAAMCGKIACEALSEADKVLGEL